MTQKSYTVTIEKIVPGGFGIGRLPDGMIAFVRYVLPGEKVSLRPLRQKKNHVMAELEKVLEPSPHRREAVCELYGRCGGCDLQHVESGHQLQLKEEMLVESMNRGGFRPDLIAGVIRPLRPALESFGYRQRLRLHVDAFGRIGFFHPQSHRLEPAAACPLAEPEINRVLNGLRNSSSAEKLIRFLRSVELLFSPGSGKVIVLLHTTRRPRPAARLSRERSVRYWKSRRRSVS